MHLNNCKSYSLNIAIIFSRVPKKAVERQSITENPRRKPSLWLLMSLVRICKGTRWCDSSCTADTPLFQQEFKLLGLG